MRIDSFRWIYCVLYEFTLFPMRFSENFSLWELLSMNFEYWRLRHYKTVDRILTGSRTVGQILWAGSEQLPKENFTSWTNSQWTFLSEQLFSNKISSTFYLPCPLLSTAYLVGSSRAPYWPPFSRLNFRLFTEESSAHFNSRNITNISHNLQPLVLDETFRPRYYSEFTV